MATLINGDGNQAIYAQQDADWFASIIGGQTLITAVGNKFAYELLDANTIGVKDGVIITKEGRRIQLDANAIDSFDIPTGGQGTTNYYIIGYHLVTGDLSEQTAETFVQLMDNATDTIPEGSFRDGDDDVYISLYRVQQVDLTLGTITLLIPRLENSLQQSISENVGDIETILQRIPSIEASLSNKMNKSDALYNGYISNGNIDTFTQNGWYWLNGYEAGVTGTFPATITKEQHYIFYNSNNTTKQILIPLSERGVWTRQMGETWLAWQNTASPQRVTVFEGTLTNGQTLAIPSFDQNKMEKLIFTIWTTEYNGNYYAEGELRLDNYNYIANSNYMIPIFGNFAGVGIGYSYLTFVPSALKNGGVVNIGNGCQLKKVTAIYR